MNQEFEEIINKNSSFFKNNLLNLNIQDYVYNPLEAIEELGLETADIDELLQEYITQMLQTKIDYLRHIQNLRKDLKYSRKLDYTPLRELAHKNLGVAKNLRIKDAILILDELMKKDDLEYLFLCINALEACAVRLKQNIHIKQ